MKLQPDRLEGVNAISRHAAAEIYVGATRFTGSVLVPWKGEVRPWEPRHFDELAPAHFEALVALGPELVIFGSGSRLRFAPPACLAALMARRIGVESMDSAAACRTYNVLASEGRQVVAVLLLDGPA